jgi:redox-sensitive bicupin YhaK (pirin superfamily)
MSRIDVEEELLWLASPPAAGVEITAPRDVPLGGPRSMSVRRALPNRSRTTIGPWCFVDHYGPDKVADSGGMAVPPHPHTGLQTVSWLFEGEIHHRDSIGTDALVVPGELNIMTAGHGVQHSEVSTPETSVLHGVQLWVALPDSHRAQSPHFAMRKSLVAKLNGAEVRLITGSLNQVGLVDSPHYWPMVAAQIDLPRGGRLRLEVDPQFEHGVLVVGGETLVNETGIPEHHLAYLPSGSAHLTLQSKAPDTRVILFGGKPFEEPITVWWNFIGRDHEELEAARQEWQQGLLEGSTRFGHIADMSALPAPEMPHGRLKSRPPGSRAG